MPLLPRGGAEEEEEQSAQRSSSPGVRRRRIWAAQETLKQRTLNMREYEAADMEKCHRVRRGLSNSMQRAAEDSLTGLPPPSISPYKSGHASSVSISEKPPPLYDGSYPLYDGGGVGDMAAASRMLPRPRLACLALPSVASPIPH